MLNIDVDCNPPPEKNSYKNSDLQNKIDKITIIWKNLTPLLEANLENIQRGFEHTA